MRVADAWTARPSGSEALVLAALLVCAPGAHAQEWRIEAAGGRYRTEGAPVGGTDGTALLGLRWLDEASWVGVLGGIPLTSADAPWGSLTTALRLARGSRPLSWGIRLSGQAFAQGARADSATVERPLPPIPGNVPLQRRGPLGGGIEPALAGWGASGEVTPLLAFRTSTVALEARAGVAGFHSDFADQEFDRALAVAHLSVSRALGASLVLRAEAKSHWADEGTYPFLGTSALLTRTGVTAWVSLGSWLHPDVTTTPWSVGASVDVGDRVALSGSVRRDAFDPLFQTPARTSWSLGASVAVGRRSTPRAPVPERYEHGVATLTLGTDQVDGAPSVAGDFNGWRPQAMSLRDGRWTLPVVVEPGVYYYAFVAADGSWFVPESVPGRKPDGFGGHVAVLVVG